MSPVDFLLFWRSHFIVLQWAIENKKPWMLSRAVLVPTPQWMLVQFHAKPKKLQNQNQTGYACVCSRFCDQCLLFCELPQKCFFATKWPSWNQHDGKLYLAVLPTPLWYTNTSGTDSAENPMIPLSWPEHCPEEFTCNSVKGQQPMWSSICIN